MASETGPPRRVYTLNVQGRDAGLSVGPSGESWWMLPDAPSTHTDKGANAGLKVTALVTALVAGADSIDDMAVLRPGGMKKLFTGAYAPSALGSFLRFVKFGHVRQLDTVASRFLTNLHQVVPLLGTPMGSEDGGGFVFLDVDDTIVEVHGYQNRARTVGTQGFVA